MKIGFIGCSNYNDLFRVQGYIEFLQYIYRPFGNCDDEWEEPVTIITELKKDLDCVTAIKATKVNFKVKHVEDKTQVINQSRKVIFFWDGKCKHCKDWINLALDKNKSLEVRYNNG